MVPLNHFEIHIKFALFLEHFKFPMIRNFQACILCYWRISVIENRIMGTITNHLK